MDNTYITLENLNSFIGAYSQIDEHKIVIDKKNLKNRKIIINNVLGESLKRLPVYLRDESLKDDLYVGNAEITTNSFVNEGVSVDEYIWKPRKHITKNLYLLAKGNKELTDMFINESSRDNDIYLKNSNIFDKFETFLSIQENMKNLFELNDSFTSDVKKHSLGHIHLIKEKSENKLYLSLDDAYVTTFEIGISGINRINILENFNNFTEVNIFTRTVTRENMVGILESINNIHTQDYSKVINNKTMLNILYENELIESMDDFESIMNNLSKSKWDEKYDTVNLFNITFKNRNIHVKDLSESYKKFNFIKDDDIIKVNLIEETYE